MTFLWQAKFILKANSKPPFPASRMLLALHRQRDLQILKLKSELVAPLFGYHALIRLLTLRCAELRLTTCSLTTSTDCLFKVCNNLLELNSLDSQMPEHTNWHGHAHVEDAALRRSTTSLAKCVRPICSGLMHVFLSGFQSQLHSRAFAAAKRG